MSKHLESEALLAPARRPMAISLQTAGDVSKQMEHLLARESTDESQKKELAESSRLTESAFLF